jgi:hypothetical protein
MIQLAWRFLLSQKESALALWYRARTADSRIGTRKTMIVADSPVEGTGFEPSVPRQEKWSMPSSSD